MTDIYAEITKINPDRREVFGWASITEMGGKPVVDLQGDYIETSELEKAAYDYVLDSRVGGAMHERMRKSAPKQVGTLIESFVVTPEKVEKMGLPKGALPSGWWIGFKVNDDSVWKSVKDAKYTGFSIHGKGVRKQETMEVSNVREDLLRKAFMHSSNQVEFTKNIAGIADALTERGHVEAHYFGEIVKHLVQGPIQKHLIGSHEQDDHDPTKKGGGGHKRSQHGNKNKQRSTTAMGIGGLMASSPAVMSGRGFAALPAVAATGAIGSGIGYLYNRNFASPNRKVKKTLTRKEYETLSKYLSSTT